MHPPEQNELVQTIDDEYGIATGRKDRWGEHFEIDLGDRKAFYHYEDLYEVSRG